MHKHRSCAPLINNKENAYKSEGKLEWTVYIVKKYALWRCVILFLSPMHDYVQDILSWIHAYQITPYLIV